MFLIHTPYVLLLDPETVPWPHLLLMTLQVQFSSAQLHKETL